MKIHALSIALVIWAAPALAHDVQAGSLRISHPWTRPAAAGQNGAGDMVITNTGAQADILVSVTAAGARDTTIHQSMMHGDMASMVAVTDGLVIPPGGAVTLAPGGYHLMFTGLKAKTNPGDTLPATLTFARAGAVKVTFDVQASSATADHPRH